MMAWKYLVSLFQPNGNAKSLLSRGATIRRSNDQPSIGSVDSPSPRKKSHYKFDVHLMNTL